MAGKIKSCSRNICRECAAAWCKVECACGSEAIGAGFRKENQSESEDIFLDKIRWLY
nr:MAG TPA: hypothetical protein [Caudoviricetes sp.]